MEVWSAAETKKSKHTACSTSGIHSKIIFATSPREPISVYKYAEMQPIVIPRKNGMHNSNGAPIHDRLKNSTIACISIEEKNEPDATEEKLPL